MQLLQYPRHSQHRLSHSGGLGMLTSSTTLFLPLVRTTRAVCPAEKFQSGLLLTLVFNIPVDYPKLPEKNVLGSSGVLCLGGAVAAPGEFSSCRPSLPSLTSEYIFPASSQSCGGSSSPGGRWAHPQPPGPLQGFVEEETTPLPQALLQGHEEAGSVTLTGQPGSLEAVI